MSLMPTKDERLAWAEEEVKRTHEFNTQLIKLLSQRNLQGVLTQYVRTYLEILDTTINGDDGIYVKSEQLEEIQAALRETLRLIDEQNESLRKELEQECL